MGAARMVTWALAAALSVAVPGAVRAQSDPVMTGEERALVGCWEVRSPLLDSLPWRFALDSIVEMHGLAGRVMRRIRPFGEAQRAWRHGAWGPMYPGLDDLYLSLGSAPGALEVALAVHGDSLGGRVSIISDRPPHRQPVAQPFVATRVACPR